MKAIVVHQWTTFDKLRLEDVEEPVLEPNQVKIRVQAAGISFAMSLVVQGLYQRKPPRPFIPGTEIAGIVEEIGTNTRRFKIGDRVCAVLDWGGLAETAVAREVNTYPIPDELNFCRAIGFTNSYATSAAALTWSHLLNVKANDVLLVHGATGGVGLAAIQIGKILRAKVIATVSSAAKLKIAYEHGADHVINHTTSDFRESVLEITSNKGANSVFDPIGGKIFMQSLRCMAPEGRIIPVGFASGTIPQIPANILLVKNLTVCGLNLGLYFGWTPTDKRYEYEKLFRNHMTKLFAWFSQGKINPVVRRVFPLDQASNAMNLVLKRQSVGRIAVVMNEEKNNQLTY